MPPKLNKAIRWVDESIPIPLVLLAKTIKLQNNTSIPGMSVEEHCIVVGKCAVHLAKDIMKHTPAMYGCKSWNEVAFICAVHDVGKCSPGFQRKLYHALGEQLTGMKPYDKADREYVTNHALVSQVELMDLNFAKAARIAGIHHGFSESSFVQDATRKEYGGEKWQHVRYALIDRLIKQFNVDPNALIDYAKIEFEMLLDTNPIDLGEYRLTGLCVISDWVASDAFGRHSDISNITFESIEEAFVDRGFVGFTFKPNLSFGDIFGEWKDKHGTKSWHGYKPNASQREIVKFITEHGPGKVYVIEDQMGAGKTELAEYAAYMLNSRGMANGIIFALPTKATSNQMLIRFNEFLSQVVDNKTQHHVAKLIHGSARLYQDFVDTNAPGSHFYSRSTTAMLLPFQVATIDQVVMASMNVEFAGVRAYGLMGKVVIIDEVHSMDAYTSTLIQTLIRLCVNSGATVLMLSATLNNSALARFALLTDVGSNKSFPRLSVIDYSQKPKNRVRRRKITPTATEKKKIDKKKKVKIQYGTTRSDALEQAYDAYLRGGQVAWVDNLVDYAHEAYRWFINRGVDTHNIVCLTSRNTDGWRRDNETVWCDMLGKEGDRSVGRIVVGTQVIEQSLNIDFDIMFSLLAYSDSMLQRLGRLMRFDNLPNRNPAFTDPLFVVVYPTDDFGSVCDACMSRRNRKLDDSDIVDMVRELWRSLDKTRYVYEHTIFLMTTHRVWKQLKYISLPNDIRGIIDNTYNHRSEIGVYGWLQEQYQNTIDRMERMAYSRCMVTDALTKQLSHRFTRIQEDEDKIRVLMLKHPPVGTTIVLNDKRDLASDTIDVSTLADMKFAEKLKYIIAIESNMVSVPAKIAPPGLLSDIQFMVDQRLVYAGNPDNEDHLEQPMARFGIIRGGVVYDVRMRPLRTPCGMDKNIGYYKMV